MRKIIEYTLVAADGVSQVPPFSSFWATETKLISATAWASCWPAMPC